MKIGLSLSGSGVRAAAHIGVLKVFKKHGIPIDLISGTSAASLVAALYATGYSAADMEDIFLSYQNSPRAIKKLIDPDYLAYISFLLSGLFKKQPSIDGFIKGNNYQNLIDTLIHTHGHNMISDSLIPLAIPAVDLETAKIIMFVSDKTMLFDDTDIAYHDDISYSKAVRASSSFPAIFKPVLHECHRLVDGGIRENLPIDVLREMGADVIIGVNAGYYGEYTSTVSDITRIASRVLDIMNYSITENFAETSDILICPEVHDIETFQFNKITHCIKCGEDVAENSIDLLKSIVK